MSLLKFFGTTVSLIFTACLIYASVVQCNDPDGLSWAAAYGLAAIVVAGTALTHRIPSMLGRLLSLPYASHAIYLLLSVESWDSWIEVEVAREGIGLAIAAIMLFTSSLLNFERA